MKNRKTICNKTLKRKYSYQRLMKMKTNKEINLRPTKSRVE